MLLSLATPNLKIRRLYYRIALFVGDAALTYAAMTLAYHTRFYWGPFVKMYPITKGIPSLEIYYSWKWTALGVWMAAFMVQGFYKRVNLHVLDEILRALRGVIMGWLVVLSGTFLYRRMDYSRLVLMLSAGYAVAFIFLFRQVVKILYALIVVKFWEPHVVLIMGSGRMSRSIQKVLATHPEISTVHTATRDVEELQRYLQQHEIREVFVGEPDLDHTTLIRMSEICDDYDVAFRIVPDVLELRMGEVILDDSLGFPTYEIKPITLHGWTFFYKRLFDILGSIAVFSVLLIPLIYIAYIVKLDSDGPILFQQERMGYRRRAFPFFKFRTMINNADDYLEALKKQNDRSGPVFKMKEDPRITAVGKWLRKFSVDELPQLINVLRGEMSLVGPRPQVLWEAAAYDDWARKRLNVLPGITGLWQVSGRAHLSYEEMIELDIFYIENWSPGLDLKIILRTIPTTFGAQGAF